MTTQDPVGTALAGIAAGSTTGGCIMTAGVFVVRVLQLDDAASLDSGASVITASLFGGIVAAAGSGWLATLPIDDVWRRGVTGAVSVLGAALLAIGATAADQFIGVIGVGTYCALLGVAAVLFHRKARDLGRS